MLNYQHDSQKRGIKRNRSEMSGKGEGGWDSMNCGLSKCISLSARARLNQHLMLGSLVHLHWMIAATAGRQQCIQNLLASTV